MSRSSEVSRLRLELEARFLGNILLTGKIPHGLTEDVLRGSGNAELFAQMQRHLKATGSIDAASFAAWMGLHGYQADTVVEALTQEAMAVTPELQAHYLGILRDECAAEKLRETLLRFAGETGDPETIRTSAMDALRKLSKTGWRKARSISDGWVETLNELDRRFHGQYAPGVRIGLPTLDKITGGFQQSDLVILAARPAVGKTAMALNWTLHAARAGKRVLFFSAEQPEQQVIQRIASMATGVGISGFRNPRLLSKEQWDAIGDVTAEISKLPIEIADLPAPHIQDLSRQLDALEDAPDFVVVDYLQRIKGGGQDIYSRTSDVVQTLKELARTHNIPVLCLSQINRSGDGAASMNHLKGSGDIEQEADQVLILERNGDGATQTAQLNMDKNRHGPVCMIELTFNAPCLQFGELDVGSERNTEDKSHHGSGASASRGNG